MGDLENVDRATEVLNTNLDRLYRAKRPIELEVSGRPRLHIISYAPLVYEAYGHFRNRAPVISGSLALRCILTAESQAHDSLYMYLGLQAGREGYGFPVREAGLINDIARLAGLPELAFYTA